MPKFMKPVIVIILAVGVAAGAAVFLSRGSDQPVENPSTPSRAEIKPGGHSRGPQNAPVTLVEFGDYECPVCGTWYPFVNELLTRYPDKLRLEFHHYPLVSVHPNAMAGAMAAEAAGEQGKYWEMHDALFEHQREWGESPNPKPYFMNFASHIGLDLNRFEQSLSSPGLQSRILTDVSQAQDLHIEGTPTFFLNGQLIQPKLNMEELVQLVETRLHK
ncbi:MAG TPA: thioredoxin domain-containing protein [Terriglobia bacterium]